MNMEPQLRDLFMDLHDSLNREVKQLFMRIEAGGCQMSTPLWPPNTEFTEDDVAALDDVSFSPSERAALEKLVRAMAYSIVLGLLSNIDGVSSPKYSNEKNRYISYKLLHYGKDEPANKHNDLMSNFGEAYWDWMKKAGHRRKKSS